MGRSMRIAGSAEHCILAANGIAAIAGRAFPFGAWNVGPRARPRRGSAETVEHSFQAIARHVAQKLLVRSRSAGIADPV